MKTYLLSHHPVCENFDNHTINIGKYRFCIGCYVGYPTAIIGLLLLWILNIFFAIFIYSTYLLIISVVLISSFVLSPLNLTKIKIIKIFQKFFIGLGGAFLFWWIWLQNYVFIVKFMYLLVIFGFLLTALNAYHLYGDRKICKKCEYSLNWEICPGFKEIFECFKRYNLRNILKLPKKK